MSSVMSKLSFLISDEILSHKATEYVLLLSTTLTNVRGMDPSVAVVFECD